MCRHAVYVRFRKACSQFLERPLQHTAIGPFDRRAETLEHVTSNDKECTVSLSAFKWPLKTYLFKLIYF